MPKSTGLSKTSSVYHRFNVFHLGFDRKNNHSILERVNWQALHSSNHARAAAACLGRFPNQRLNHWTALVFFLMVGLGQVDGCLLSFPVGIELRLRRDKKPVRP